MATPSDAQRGVAVDGNLGVTRAMFWAWNSSSIQLLNYFGLEGLVESFQAFHPGWASWPSYAKAFLPSDRYVNLPIGLIWPQGHKASI